LGPKKPRQRINDDGPKPRMGQKGRKTRPRKMGRTFLRTKGGTAFRDAMLGEVGALEDTQQAIREEGNEKRQGSKKKRHVARKRGPSETINVGG